MYKHLSRIIAIPPLLISTSANIDLLGYKKYQAQTWQKHQGKKLVVLCITYCESKISRSIAKFPECLYFIVIGLWLHDCQIFSVLFLRSNWDEYLVSFVIQKTHDTYIVESDQFWFKKYLWLHTFWTSGSALRRFARRRSNFAPIIIIISAVELTCK